ENGIIPGMPADQRDARPICQVRKLSGELEVAAEEISVMVETADDGVADAPNRVRRVEAGEIRCQTGPRLAVVRGVQEAAGLCPDHDLVVRPRDDAENFSKSGL